MSNDDDITNPMRITGEHKYSYYIQEETETRKTGNSYINTEYEMWAGLKPEGLVPLKDQRKSIQDYYPQEYANIPIEHQNVTSYSVSVFLSSF
jgi:hypothetical protein